MTFKGSMRSEGLVAVCACCQLSIGGGGGGGGVYSHILALRVCAAGKSMVFKPFTLG